MTDELQGEEDVVLLARRGCWGTDTSGMGCGALCPPGRTAQDYLLMSVCHLQDDFSSVRTLFTGDFLAISTLNVQILRYSSVFALERMLTAEIKLFFFC